MKSFISCEAEQVREAGDEEEEEDQDEAETTETDSHDTWWKDETFVQREVDLDKSVIIQVVFTAGVEAAAAGSHERSQSGEDSSGFKRPNQEVVVFKLWRSDAGGHSQQQQGVDHQLQEEDEEEDKALPPPLPPALLPALPPPFHTSLTYMSDMAVTEKMHLHLVERMDKHRAAGGGGGGGGGERKPL
ncbi:unnamed protein product [Pleuronectes platessa]|uniref:Uncharacterized protein n=1 Tax=Pleuronectes platessa TaxID=8262 RepID=A0A9N7UYB0_PLEPL|nr:unnamed protein product [Pleuronectes platessa]